MGGLGGGGGGDDGDDGGADEVVVDGPFHPVFAGAVFGEEVGADVVGVVLDVVVEGGGEVAFFGGL